MITPSSAYLAEHVKPARTPIYQVRLTVPHPLNSTLVPNLKAYWRLDETSGVRYDAIGLANLQDRNTVTSSAGKIGNAATFSSANQECLSCVLPLDSPLRTGDVSFGIAAWVKLATLTTDQVIISQYSTTGALGGYELFFDKDNQRFRFQIRSDEAIADTFAVKIVLADSFGAPSANTWYFVAAWHDAATDFIKISVNNGTVDTTATAGKFPPQAINTPFLIGADSSGTSQTPTHFLNGSVDECSFWSKAFSGADLTQLYNSGAGYAIPFTDPSIKDLCTAHPLSGEDIGLELIAPMELDRRAEIEQCRLPLSTLTVDVNDVDEAASAIMAVGVPGALCELRASFYDIAWSENVLLFTGIVSEVEHDAGVYKITSRSRMAAADDKVLFNAAKTQLTADIGDGDTTLPADNTDAFATTSPDINQTYSIVIDNEFMFPRAKNSSAFLNVQRVGTTEYAVPPLIPDSEATTHKAGAVIREMVELGQLTGTNHDAGTNDIHPIDLLYRILGTQAKYGIGELNITANVAELAAARTALGPDIRFRFMDDQPINAKKFIEEELYRVCAMWPTENNRGELGAKVFPLIAPGVFDGSISDSTITQFPKWLHNAEKRINVVIYYYDYNPITREYTSTFEYRDETLIAQHGRELPLIIYSKGLRSQYTQTAPVVLTWFSGTDAFLLDAAQRHIARFGNTSPVIGVSSIFTNNMMELSDDLQATFAQAINVDSGTRQITNAPMELAAMRYDFESNLIDMELLAYPS